MNKITVTQILSNNCGGYGAWMDNVHSSAAPNEALWPGFQLGGGGGSSRRVRNRRKRVRNTRYKKYIKNKKTMKNKYKK